MSPVDPHRQGGPGPAALALAMDSVAAEVSAAFAAEGVPSLLLKGPALAEYLYPGEVRAYEDCDLLVDPAIHRRAEQVLSRLGFERDVIVTAGVDTPEPVAAGWSRDWARVDLHRSFWGMSASPDEIWARLSAEAQEQHVARRAVRVPARPAQLLLVALHAVHHGTAAGRPMEDLRRALESGAEQDWSAGLALAGDLGAERGFVAALQLHPAGTGVAERIGVRRGRSLEAAVSQARLPVSEGFERFAQAGGWRERGRVIRSEVLPGGTFMRWRYPAARRGRLGLARSYAGRFADILAKASRALGMALILELRRLTGRR